MSNLIVPNDSKKTNMQLILNGLFIGTKIRLFQNNYTPVAATVIGDLTEATFSGYAQITLAGGAVAGALDAENRAVITWNAVTFTKAGATGNTIYGYYIVDNGGVLLWLERFDAPISMTTDGAFITITPKFTGKSQYVNS